MYRLLIVDDEEKICQGLARNVNWESVGIGDIYTASNAGQALQIVKDYPPDVMITDVKMPRQTGLELVEKVKRLNDKARFIIISGYPEFTYVQTALHLHVDAYLLKPVNIPELLKVVREILHISEDVMYPKPASVHQVNQETASRQYSPLVHRCIQYLSENYYKPITLVQIGELMERNASYISHIFRVETGMVITDYLTSLRINKAQELINSSNLMLYEIAGMVGYSDYRQFNRAYRKWTGKTPKSVQDHQEE